jgi:hypothetical protein
MAKDGTPQYEQNSKHDFRFRNEVNAYIHSASQRKIPAVNSFDRMYDCV